VPLSPPYRASDPRTSIAEPRVARQNPVGPVRLRRPGLPRARRHRFLRSFPFRIKRTKKRTRDPSRWAPLPIKLL
jgi:hypothetical protein